MDGNELAVPGVLLTVYPDAEQGEQRGQGRVTRQESSRPLPALSCVSLKHVAVFRKEGLQGEREILVPGLFNSGFTEFVVLRAMTDDDDGHCNFFCNVM